LAPTLAFTPARLPLFYSHQPAALPALWADWRELKLERELWRSLDLLGLSRQPAFFRRKYYANFFEPASLASRVSI
jgi:hypothetical protein